jgi:hypothetical protein
MTVDGIGEIEKGESSSFFLSFSQHVTQHHDTMSTNISSNLKNEKDFSYTTASNRNSPP